MWGRFSCLGVGGRGRESQRVGGESGRGVGGGDAGLGLYVVGLLGIESIVLAAL